MEQSLKSIWHENNSSCLLTHEHIQAALIVDSLARDTFMKRVVSKRGEMKNLGMAKSGYDLEKNQTLAKNMKYKKIKKDRFEKFATQCSFSFTEKIGLLSEVNYQQARIVYGLVDSNILIIDELFTDKLSKIDQQELTAFIQKLQQTYDCIILPVLEQPKYGVLFEHLFVYQNQSQQFLTIK